MLDSESEIKKRKNPQTFATSTKQPQRRLHVEASYVHAA